MARKTSHKSYTLWSLIFLFCQILQAQQPPIYFDHITTEEGLSQNDINCIFQDSQGFMWFGTNDGLNKYNGYKFTIYKPKQDSDNSISSNLIFSIAEDSQHRLWIGTTGKGLNLFDTQKETFTIYQNAPDDSSSLISNYITKVLVDRKDRLWVTTNNGLELMDLKRPEEGFYHLSNNSENTDKTILPSNVNTVFEDQKGHIFVGTSTGAYQITIPEGSIDLKAIIVEPILEEKSVRAIIKDRYGKLILGTFSGLLYEEGDKQFTELADGTHYDLVIDDDYNIWSGTGNGLYFFKANKRGSYPELTEVFQSNPYYSSYLSKNNIKSIFKDAFGLIWIGTNGGGINKINPRRKPFHHFQKTLNPTSLSYNKIRSVYEDSYGTIWMGTEGGGLNRQHSSAINGKYNNFSVIDNPSRIFAITEYEKDAKHYLIAGSEMAPGLFYVDITDNPRTLDSINTVTFPGVNPAVFSILKDRKKNLWIGTYSGGLFKWHKEDIIKRDVFTRYESNPADSNSLPNNIIRCLFEDSKGNIWVGTGDGLSKLGPSEALKRRPEFITYKSKPKDPNSISHNYILAIHEDQNGNLWIGTFGGGLNKFIPSGAGQAGHFERFTTKDGLPNDVVKGILEDDKGCLWLATNKGLSRFDPAKKTFTNFDVNDGLQSNEFSELACYRLYNGDMIFGGVNGFNVFNPEEIKLNKDIPLVAITELSILNQSVGVGERVNGRVLLPDAITSLKNIRLKNHESSFSLEFAALHYSAPTKNQYAYKLEGFNKDWVFTNSEKRFATYTNLSPGDYTFHLKASNNDGNWSAPIQLRITIIPPIWLTWYAYVFYTLILLFLLWLFRRYTLIGVAEKHKLTIEHLEKEKAEELHQMKLRFFTNISHELRTPLTLIIGPLENLLKQKQGINFKEQRQDLHLMYKNSRYLLRLVNQLLDFRKLDQGKMKLSIQHGNIVRFIQEVTEPFQFLANKKKIHFEISSAQEKILLWFDPDVLEKILYNLLSNAFKFTPENGKILVTIAPEDRSEGSSTKNEKINKYLKICVKDTGPGIPAKFKKKVFERFYKTPAQSFGNRMGAGIGLAFTKSLVELHHGQIKIKSKPNKGTTFKILLPLDRTVFAKEEFKTNISSLLEMSDKAIPSSVMAPPLSTNQEISVAHLNTLTDRDQPLLLVIDDHEDLRAYINRSFAPDFKVIEAADGHEGLQKTLEFLPDLIISDISMPRIDGITLCNQLKSEEQTSHIPIILLTAKASQESELAGLQTGADAYVKKPFNMEVLKTRVQNIFKLRRDLQKRFRKEVSLEPSEITVTSLDESFLKQAIKVVEDHMSDTEFTVEEMVKEMAVSRSKLYLKLKALTGQSSSEFIRTIRLKRAVQLFDQSDYSVKEIMYMTGFNTSSYFSKCFKKQFGVLPSEYARKKHKVQENGKT